MHACFQLLQFDFAGQAFDDWGSAPGSYLRHKGAYGFTHIILIDHLIKSLTSRFLY